MQLLTLVESVWYVRGDSFDWCLHKSTRAELCLLAMTHKLLLRRSRENDTLYFSLHGALCIV